MTLTDTVYTLIANGELYVDLHRAQLTEPAQVQVFASRDVAEAYGALADRAKPARKNPPHTVNMTVGASIEWDGRPWSIINVGDTIVTLKDANDHVTNVPSSAFEAQVAQGHIRGLASQLLAGMSAEAHNKLVSASPQDLKEAHRRHRAIRQRQDGRSAREIGVPERTLRDWSKKFRNAQQLWGDGFLGLLPATKKRGNRNAKLPQDTLDLMYEFILNQYETPTQKNMYVVYGELLRECQQRVIMPPSYKTFAGAVHRRPRHEQISKRKGPRAAYVHERFYFELSRTTPRHGDRPFEIGHIDHTQLDVELVSSDHGHNLGRPWATFLVDAYSRRLLAFYLTFDPPSYRSCMMVLRACVQQHNRLPQTIVVDGGKEFHSLYFDTLLARYEVTKKTRPGAKARFGSVCERLFGTANTEFIHNLAGNTQIMKNIRQVTKDWNPKGRAQWTLHELHDYLAAWAGEVYDTRDHPTLGASPRDTFAAGLLRTGSRDHRLIPYDEDFRMMTLPSTAKGTAMVQKGMGVRIQYIYYWSEEFRDPAVQRTLIPVRYDPFDAGIAYAYVHNRWVTCVSQYQNIFTGKSEREIALATAEMRSQRREHARNFSINAKHLADFLASASGQETLQEQRCRDREMAIVREVSVVPEPDSLRVTPDHDATGLVGEGHALTGNGELRDVDPSIYEPYEDYR